MLDERINKLFKHSTTPPESVVELLKKTLIGTSGTKYQLLDTESKIHDLHKPHYIYIERNNRAIGNITICEREVTIPNKKVNALYLRYFAFERVFQSKGTKVSRGKSSFHKYISAVFSTSNLNLKDPEHSPTFYWAYIDPSNSRSFNMNKALGFEDIGAFETKIYSRYKPKKSSNVFRIKENEKEEVLNSIRDFYKDYSLFSDVHIFEKDNFFVLKENGKIVCGIQLNPSHWIIKKLPGKRGRFLIKTLPYTPIIRRIINPNKHNFLASEGVFWEEGYEHKIDELLNGAMAITGYHSVLFWEDLSVNRIRGLALKWGLLEKLKVPVDVKIIGRFVNFPEEDKRSLKNSPKYLSGFDMT